MKRKSKFVSFFLILIMVSIILIPAKVFAAGLGVRVLPGSDDSPLGGNTRLWFAISKGQSDFRKIEVINRGPEVLRIKLELLNAIERDGRLVPEEVQSPLNDFFSPSDNNFVMKASTSRVITLEISSDSDSIEGERKAILAVTASPDIKIKRSDDGGTKAIGQNNLRFTIPIYVIIGSGNRWNVDFEINKIVDLTVNNRKVLDIYFENTGDLPLGLKGRVEFVSSEFKDLKFGPYSFGSEAIGTQESGRARVELPEEFPPGNYRILVTARQADVEKTKIFESNLSFPSSNSSTMVWWLATAVILLALLTFYILLRRKVQNNEQSNL